MYSSRSGRYFPRKSSPSKEWIGDWVGPRAGLDPVENFPLVLSMALQPFETWLLLSFLILYTVGRTPWTGDQPLVKSRYLHTEQHKQNKRTQTSMLEVGFEPTIPASEWAKTVHVLERAATVIGVEKR
jgi:hypothetical protein